ncbi:P1 family peptidase [bacterium]|nr:P1 family peptidase [bacterium]
MAKLNNSITDIDGILVGQVQDMAALTGCTVIIYPNGAIGGVDQRGGAPGTRETDLLRPMHMVEKVHAILLSGGSAFGLDAASGVMKFLEEKKIGFNTGVARVPIVPAAVIFDLGLGQSDIRPSAEMGYQACQSATHLSPKQGNFGAGAGASVGKIFGMGQAMKSGIGTACIELGGNLRVAAMMVVNAFGDVLEPKSSTIIAGARTLQKGLLKIGTENYFANSLETMKTFVGKTVLNIANKQNTVIGVVATNAALTKEEANKVAQMAHNGLAKTIRPAHTMFDGDTIFVMATGKHHADVSLIGAFAAEVVAQAILNAVIFAEPAGGLPSAQSKDKI